MPNTNVNCPNCRKSIVADIDRLFDVSEDPTAKQKILGGRFNFVNCPYCGYQGQADTPIVYHDPQKELLLTYLPPDLGIPRDEQERVIGSLINQAMNRLPQEQRKAYLLNPQSTLTMQGLVERVLESEGITKEMIEAQQDRLQLIQRFSELKDEEAIEQMTADEDEKIDAEFFGLLQRLSETAMVSGDQETAQQLSDLYTKLIAQSTFGKQVQAQNKEIETALADLREAGEELDREKLLDLVIQAPNETRLRALVSLARPVMDYSFLLMLGERIDRARGDGRTRLVELRSSLVEMIEEFDKQIEAIIAEKNQLIDEILSSNNIKETMAGALPAVDEFFISEINQRLENARSQGDLELIEKLQQIQEVIKEASQPPAGFSVIESLLGEPDKNKRLEILEENQEEITPEFMSMLSTIIVQAQSSDDKELVNRASEVNREVLRFSMEKNIR
jgi:hypothetical protein